MYCVKLLGYDHVKREKMSFPLSITIAVQMRCNHNASQSIKQNESIALAKFPGLS